MPSNYTFGGLSGVDVLTQLPDASTTFTVASGSPYTFNPFAGVTVADNGASTGNMTMRLIFADLALAGSVNGETLFQVVGGVTTTHFLNSTLTFSGNAANVQTWLQSIYIVDFRLFDRFRLTLRGTDSEGVNGTSRTISYQLACYARGTTIQTPSGAQAVEALQIGDLVVTQDGGAQPVKWIGHRTYEAAFGAAQAFVRPVLFRAGSLGDNLPVRDLRVSPQHGMLVNGVLVPAAALVNGVSILRDIDVADVEYFHIELDGHGIVFAEGAAAETYVDENSRAMFDNADEYGLLYGSSVVGTASAAPRVEEGYQLAAVRRHLDQIAGITRVASAPGALQGNLESLDNGVLQGWIVDTADSATPVEIDVLVDGEVAARVLANRYRADLDQAGLANGMCAFSVAMPPAAESLAQITLRRSTDGRDFGAHMMDFIRA